MTMNDINNSAPSVGDIENQVSPSTTTTTASVSAVSNPQHDQQQQQQVQQQSQGPTIKTHRRRRVHKKKRAEDQSVASSTSSSSNQTNASSSSTATNNHTTAPAFVYKPTKAPKETLLAIYKTGQYKAALPLNLLSVQSFMAGIFIAMAGHLYLAVGGGVLGAALFPTGLLAVILTSAELFTGDALVFVASVLGQRVPYAKLLRNWTVAWILNFCGCLFWAAILAYASDALEDVGAKDLAIKVAMKKAHQPWLNVLLKGIGANFMVCIGVWQATCAEEVAGKVLALWFPINAFVLLGLDHCIANQFLIPIGMMLGADVSMTELFWNNLVPATIGNVVGGGLLVGGIYWYVFDSMAARASQQQAKTTPEPSSLQQQQEEGMVNSKNGIPANTSSLTLPQESSSLRRPPVAA